MTQALIKPQTKPKTFSREKILDKNLPNVDNNNNHHMVLDNNSKNPFPVLDVQDIKHFNGVQNNSDKIVTKL